MPRPARTVGFLDPSWWTYGEAPAGYQTDVFDPADPRNVAAGHNSVTVTANANDQGSPSQTAGDISALLKKHQTAVWIVAASLFALAIVKGTRR